MWFVDSVIYHLSGNNGFGTWGENVKRHDIWGRNSYMNGCLERFSGKQFRIN